MNFDNIQTNILKDWNKLIYCNVSLKLPNKAFEYYFYTTLKLYLAFQVSLHD